MVEHQKKISGILRVVANIRFAMLNTILKVGGLIPPVGCPKKNNEASKSPRLQFGNERDLVGL